AEQRIEQPVFGLAVHRADNLHITGPNTKFAGLKIPAVEGEGKICFTIPSLPLLESVYYVSAAIHNWDDTEMYDYHDRLYPFRVLRGEGERYGLIALQGEWTWSG
ncbi:MAG: Wzt carbohydrate-binding domain-containing protein, partial [Anaerolineales bacterium]|nr:Wzt carbohydrate-binding domain-containing protein [Anaerolineales bacterium]